MHRDKLEYSCRYCGKLFNACSTLRKHQPSKCPLYLLLTRPLSKKEVKRGVTNEQLYLSYWANLAKEELTEVYFQCKKEFVDEFVNGQDLLAKIPTVIEKRSYNSRPVKEACQLQNPLPCLYELTQLCKCADPPSQDEYVQPSEESCSSDLYDSDDSEMLISALELEEVVREAECDYKVYFADNYKLSSVKLKAVPAWRSSLASNIVSAPDNESERENSDVVEGTHSSKSSSDSEEQKKPKHKKNQKKPPAKKQKILSKSRCSSSSDSDSQHERVEQKKRKCEKSQEKPAAKKQKTRSKSRGNSSNDSDINSTRSRESESGGSSHETSDPNSTSSSS